MRRREFIILMGSAVAWPLALRAQQAAFPVIGILASASPEANAGRLDAFRQGLKETGYVEGQNVSIEYKWTKGSNGGRMSELAALLVDHRVTVLVAAGGTESAIAAKKATKSVPIVFGIASDPVALELVATLNRPGGNVTGVTSLNIEVAPKRLELLREVLPAVTNIALLLDPTVPVLAEATERVLRAAAEAHGMQLQVLHVSNEDELERAFEDCMKLRVGALVIAPSNFFTARSEQIAQLALRHALPAIYEFRRFAAAGGLMSYGSSETEYYRLVGSYAGRILKGDSPGDLPIQQSTKVELIINLKTATTLGITIPVPILGRADEVIE
jgi:putative tryptophan/tyrosine transport system substrate-binding protein